MSGIRMARAVRRGVTLGAALVFVIPAAAGAAPAAPQPGSPGIGDPYYPKYGNGGYDVSHYKIAVDYDPATGLLTGTTTITAKATQALSSFDLDFLLHATSVTVNGQAAGTRQYVVDTPAHNYGGELVVTPKKAIARNSALNVRVEYAGVPAKTLVGGFSPWFPTPTGAVIADEAEASAWWFPANDHPLDKATYDVATTVPSGLQVLGNGRLVSQVNGHGATTWRWQETKPMATYLAFVAIGKYTVTTGTSAGGIPYTNAIAQQDVPPAAAADLARTPEVVDWLSRQWGPYPFDSAGGVVPDLAFGYALETQTRPVYATDFWQDGSDIYVVVHENAHQWFGDSVSVHHWQDIWLNEGFAGFSEWLWSEQHGDGAAQQIFDSTYASHPADDAFWQIRVSDPTAAHLFADPVYDRGAMTLQALRNRIGDPAFFQLMRDWARDHRYGNGTTAQFEALAQRLSGQDLRDFFNVWLVAAGKPAPTVDNGFPPAAKAAVKTGARVPAPRSLPQIERANRAVLAAGARI